MSNAILDAKPGRAYSPKETCTDSNQVYAAKVKRVCNLYLKGASDQVVNHCFSHDGGSKPKAVGSFEYIYSKVYCEKEAKKDCIGSLSFIKVGGSILGAPFLKLDPTSNVVAPTYPQKSKVGVDSLYHITRYGHDGKDSPLGHPSQGKWNSAESRKF